MEQRHRNSFSTIEEGKKKSSAPSVIRKVKAILFGIVAMIIGVIMVISPISKIPRIGLGIVSTYIFWFAINYYHKKCPICGKLIYINGKKNDFNCPRCG